MGGHEKSIDVSISLGGDIKRMCNEIIELTGGIETVQLAFGNIRVFMLNEITKGNPEYIIRANKSCSVRRDICSEETGLTYKTKIANFELDKLKDLEKHYCKKGTYGADTFKRMIMLGMTIYIPKMHKAIFNVESEYERIFR